MLRPNWRALPTSSPVASTAVGTSLTMSCRRNGPLSVELLSGPHFGERPESARPSRWRRSRRRTGIHPLRKFTWTLLSEAGVRVIRIPAPGINRAENVVGIDAHHDVAGSGRCRASGARSPAARTRRTCRDACRRAAAHGGGGQRYETLLPVVRIIGVAFNSEPTRQVPPSDKSKFVRLCVNITIRKCTEHPKTR